MRGGAGTLLVWAGFLAALAATLWIWSGEALPVALLGGSALATAGAGAVTGVLREPADEGERWLPGTSPGTALIAAAIVLAPVGAVFGSFLTLIAAGLLALGAGLLVVELRGARR